jgi:hypothetical protein
MDKPKKVLKKLKAIPQETPVQTRIKELRNVTIEKKEEQQLTNIRIKFPETSTLITIKPKLPAIIIEKTVSEKSSLKGLDFSVNFYVDKERNALFVDDGRGGKRKYDLDTLVNENSRTGKSIDKKDAIELANVFLKIGVKPQLKKQEFIKQIRAFIELPPE